MTIEQFRATLSADAAPAVEPALVALWHDARGDWERAHTVAQDIEGATGAWVHAYLHRKEGDLSNAAYWYERADQPVATDSLADEWGRIVAARLKALR
jgi:hypothetical protein